MSAFVQKLTSLAEFPHKLARSCCFRVTKAPLFRDQMAL
jgi:hypothetical protein